MSMEKDLKMPPAKDGLIETLNRTGWMTETPDAYSQMFIDFAPQAPGPVLDIGAAYGVAAIAALAKGAQVIANDIDEGHLAILESKALAGQRSRLKTQKGAFPDEVNFDAASLGAILACRILHFLDGPALERGIGKMFNWLAAGGKVFAIGNTVYLRNWEKCIPIYEERKKAGASWPGYFDNTAEYCTTSAHLPPHINFFDVDVLSAAFKSAGFEVETAQTFACPEYPAWARLAEGHHGRGREGAVVIARKP